MHILQSVSKVLNLTKKHMILTAKSIEVLLSVLINRRYQSFKPYLANCDECLVLGNGPSLNEVIKDLPTLRKGRDVFCVNWFAMTDDYVKIKPSHYVLHDKVYWIDDVTDELLQKREELFDRLKKDTNWPLLIFVPYAAKDSRKFEQLSNFNSNINIFYYYHSTFEPPDGIYTYIRHFLYKYNSDISFANNVLIPTIFFAINLGYKKIFIFGADHSWHEQIFVGFDNILYMKEQHFYGQANKKPFCRRKNKPYKIHEAFDLWSRVFKGHTLLEEYANKKGVKIYNVSGKSYIDAYERITVKSPILCNPI